MRFPGSQGPEYGRVDEMTGDSDVIVDHEAHRAIGLPPVIAFNVNGLMSLLGECCEVALW